MGWYIWGYTTCICPNRKSKFLLYELIYEIGKEQRKIRGTYKMACFYLLQGHSNFTLMPNILNHLICRFVKICIKNMQMENHLAKNRGTTYKNTCSRSVYRPGMLKVASNES